MFDCFAEERVDLVVVVVALFRKGWDYLHLVLWGCVGL